MLAAALDSEQYHRHIAKEDFDYVAVPGAVLGVHREAQPKTESAQIAFAALQDAINRVRAALKLGSPIPVTGVIGSATFQAAHDIATADVRVRPKGTHFAIDFLFPLSQTPILAPLRGDFDKAYIDLVERARYYASIFNLIADTVWWSTLGDVPTRSNVTLTMPQSKWPLVGAAAVGLVAGAASILLILFPRLR